MTLYVLEPEPTEAEKVRNTLDWILEKIGLYGISEYTKFSCKTLNRMRNEGYVPLNVWERLQPAIQAREFFDYDYGEDYPF